MNKVYDSEDKMINPKHYQSADGIEVIDVIKAFTDGLNGIEATDTGNIIKYACRWKNKNGIQDLEKILWYTQHLINHLKNQFGLLEQEESHEKPDELKLHDTDVNTLSKILSKKDRIRKINSSNDVELTLFDSEVCALSAILSENEISYFNSKTFTSARNFEKNQTMFIIPEDFARRILELLASVNPE